MNDRVKEKERRREIERQRQRESSICEFYSPVAVVVVPDESQEPRIPFKSFMWGTTIFLAFPGALSGSWIKNNAARTHTWL